MENVTPMVRQYLEIKRKYPGTILFFRLGDFYEMFNEDALVGSRELNITLTARQKDSASPIPMCGVPHHAASGYIAKLVSKGYRVAICEQSEPAVKGVKLVKRDVVRIITPGTGFDLQLTPPKEPIFLAAIFGAENEFGVAFLDISTGEFLATSVNGSDLATNLLEQLERFEPKEILVPEDHLDRYRSLLVPVDIRSQLSESDGKAGLKTRTGALIVPVDEHFGSLERSQQELLDQFGSKELSVYGLPENSLAVQAAAACLSYVKTTQKAAVDHIREIKYLDSKESLLLDELTLKNLDIFENRADNTKKTLLAVVDETVTSMGGRLLRSWLRTPLTRISEIRIRQLAITALESAVTREQLRYLLKEVSDLERLTARVNMGSVTPRDLIALERSLGQGPQISSMLADSPSLLLQVLSENIHELPGIRSLITRSINDDPPINVSDGGVIRQGFDQELDELRELALTGKQTIASIESRERERTGIPTLKVRHNNVFGYYIEVSKAQLPKVPEDYERKQTLANAERFSTPELKEWEKKVLGAEDRIREIEADLFRSVVDQVRGETAMLQATGRALATADVISGFAHNAAIRNYCCPNITEGDEIEIKNGRHPVVEAFIREGFVPNDVYLNNSTDRLIVVTGANMGGKSTILRQVALIQILAQIGSFVPADHARLPIVDRIWTRVGASDDLASGRSTFMVEMTETAAILRNATPRSLVLMDEIGRGTSTFDGLSIAWAVAEYLHDSPDHCAKTMFATHYHELTELAEKMPGAKNYQMAATEKDGSVVFLHKLIKGKASRSYGIAVAKLAGLPISVIERAQEVLKKLEKYELAVFSEEQGKSVSASIGYQGSLFAAANESLIDEIRDTPVEDLSPENGLELLKRIRSKIN